MKEEDIRREVQRLIRDLGFWDYHPPDDTPVATPKQITDIILALKQDVKDFFGIVRNILMPPTWRREKVSMARPDIFGLNPRGPTVVIEVKMMDPKVKIEPWIHPSIISEGQRQWLDNWQYVSMGAAFLAIGTSDQPRRLWIAPWDEWVNMEKQLGEIDLDFHIKTSNLEDHWECTWVTGGTWQLPLEHMLLGMATEQCKPDIANWKKNIYSFRFMDKKKGERIDDNTTSNVEA